MPSSIFSHQAPCLPLKIKYPNKFDGTALCLASVIPDIFLLVNYILGVDLRLISHSLIGQLILTVPFTILATVLFCKYIGPLCARIANGKWFILKPLKYFGVNDWNLLKNKQFNRRFFIVASYSALIGGITHLLLDWPSHAQVEILYPWFVWTNPNFLLVSITDFSTIPKGSVDRFSGLTVYWLLWTIESFVGLFISLYFLRYIKNRELIKKWYGFSEYK
ncbi:MAG: DUF4184 family protein [Candidatus Lokiarchaeota archaeon]|nr:DUF4184 family protein [Candidatus Lokiarchaeota archaeon]